MELELQDKTHKVPAGTGWVLEGEVGSLAQAPSSLPEGSGQTRTCLGRRENQAWLRREAHSHCKGGVGTNPGASSQSRGRGTEGVTAGRGKEGQQYLMYGVTCGT